MRQVGTLENEKRANLFTDYLLTRGVLAHIEEEEGGQWSIWVRDEDQLDLAKEDLKEFQLDPTAAIYTSSRAQAEDIRREAIRRHEQRRKNMVQVRDNWQKNRRAPVVIALIGICVAVSLVTSFGQKDSPGSIASYLFFDQVAVARFLPGQFPEGIQGGPAAFDDILHGQVWRLVTPIFLHFSLWHLVGNCYWAYVLGSQIEGRYKGAWLLWIVLLCAVIPNVAQAWFEGPSFGGFSGVAFGLFGYVWMKSRFDPQSNMYMDNFTVVLMIAWFLLCMTGRVGEIANIAHGVGLAVGVAAGFLPTMLEGQRRE